MVRIFVLTSLPFAFWFCPQAQAREVGIVFFPQVAPTSGGRSATVGSTMRQDFGAIPGTAGSVHQPSFASDTDITLGAPRRARQQQGRLGELSVAVGLNFMQAAPGALVVGGDACGVNPYRSTGWLPQEAEVRRATFFDTMASIACEYDLPTNLLDAVITQESGYNAWAISRAGAMGMMQIMPGTARTLGLAQPFDAVANMRAGARYLRQQIDRFGRIDLALAAYNSGPERRSLKAGYIPAIPETQHYVRTITTNWARLASRSPELVTAHDRGTAAMQAAYASGYRRVELISYQGSNAANPI